MRTLAWYLAVTFVSARATLVGSLAGCAAGSAAVVMATDPEVAVFGRAVAGFAGAGLPATAQALISFGRPSGQLGRALSGFIAAVVLGSFAGQALVGVLAGVTSVTVALALVTVAAPLAFATIVAVVVPPSPVELLHVPAGPGSIWPVLVVVALTFGGYWLLLARLPVVLRAERFELHAEVAAVVPLLGVLGMLTVWFSGRCIDRHGPRRPVGLLLLLGLAGLVLTLPASGLPVFLLGLAAFLSAYWGLVPAAASELTLRTDPGQRRCALTMMYTAMWVGAAVTPFLAPDAASWAHVVVVAAIAWMAAAAIAWRAFGHGLSRRARNERR